MTGNAIVRRRDCASRACGGGRATATSEIISFPLRPNGWHHVAGNKKGTFNCKETKGIPQLFSVTLLALSLAPCPTELIGHSEVTGAL